MDAFEAHREEIWEALQDAASTGHVERFRSFQVEWDRLEANHPDPDHEPVTFAGDPSLFEAQIYCAHCDSLYYKQGISFGPFQGERLVRMHVMLTCDAAEECNCWVDADEGAASPPVCQECDEMFEDCTCEEGPAAGPCLVAVHILEQQVQGDASG